MATESEQLILRGLNIMIRTTFAPNDPAAQAQHFAGLTADIGPWFTDYAAEIAKPAEEFRTIVREVTDADGKRSVETNGPTDTAVIVSAPCPHCGATKDRQRCSADPMINAEPSTYCSVAKASALDEYDHECIPGN